MQLADEFAQAPEVIAGQYYFVWLRRPDSVRLSSIASSNITYNIDNELLYEPFFADFGPLNLGKAWRFCQRTRHLLQEAEKLKKRVYFVTGPHAHHKANAAVLVGIFQVMYLNRTAEEAYKCLLPYKPYVPFRDASCGVSTFHLTIFDCIKGIQKARDVGFVDWHQPKCSFNADEYEFYEQVENGDLNWIVPGKFVAFSGPSAKPTNYGSFCAKVPEDYWEYFRKKGVTAIVRLNKKVYDRKRFSDGGFRHYDMYFPDGSCPTEAIIHRFLETVEAEPGAAAVHCKAGLGRTGVLLCCYMMKHYKFTAEEAIGYIRVCRPGSVIGPQQHFLREVEQMMWREGDLQRAQVATARIEVTGDTAKGPDSSKTMHRQMSESIITSAQALSLNDLLTLTSNRAVSAATSGAASWRSMTPSRYSTMSGSLQRSSSIGSRTSAGSIVRSVSVDRSDRSERLNTAPPGGGSIRVSNSDTSSRPRSGTDRYSSGAGLEVSAAWKVGPPAGDKASMVSKPASAPGSPKTGSVARVLAANGQPRKVPNALLGFYNQALGKTSGSRVPGQLEVANTMVSGQTKPYSNRFQYS